MMSIIESNHWRLLVAKLPNGTGELHHEVIFAFLSPPKIPDLREAFQENKICYVRNPGFGWKISKLYFGALFAFKFLPNNLQSSNPPMLTSFAVGHL